MGFAKMTKEEFITYYMKDGKIDPKYRTPNGFRVPGFLERAVWPCTCGESYCQGWIMEYIDDKGER
jgi:hypothetical protein